MPHWDAIVIGSGFGGSLAAWPLVLAGLDVLMIERGPWVERGPHNWTADGTLLRTPYWRDGGAYRALTDRGAADLGSCACVGGASVFYGAVSFRYRERDLLPDPEIVTDSGSRWPLSYGELEPYYTRVERILSVAGAAGEDPIEPTRRGGFPKRPTGLSDVALKIGEAGRKLGLRPFRLPLAIRFPENGNGNGRAAASGNANGNAHGQGAGDRSPGTCIQCATCDSFACAVHAKNDLATRVLPGLMARGMELLSRTAVTRLHTEGGRVAAVDVLDRRTGVRSTLTADTFVLAAGAIGSPQLLLSSGLAERNPAADAIGRYLTRHCAGIAYGVYPRLAPFGDQFHKQLGFNDFYFGDRAGGGPPGKLGNIQQVQTPSMGAVGSVVPPYLQPLARPLVERATGLLVLAEDRPQYDNCVSLDPAETDEFGLPRPVIRHRYADRDLAARRHLIDRSKQIQRAAGAAIRYVHLIDTFSHALGTVRMGDDPSRDPLDRDCRFRGIENLYVTDGSALPTSGGVNPSLTIAAVALRAGDRIAARAATANGAWRTLPVSG